MNEQALLSAVAGHLAQVKKCKACPNMIGPVITPKPVITRVYLCGQAPGPREGDFGKPFAWTAGKTMFKWFASIGINEEQFRSLAFIGAVCRCFPGKTKQGGDRVPSAQEVSNCSSWMNDEFHLLKPTLVIPVGRLAIERFLPAAPLSEIIGKQYRVTAFDQECDLIPLPHPSGASTWFKKEPGATLLAQALTLLQNNQSWIQIVAAARLQNNQ